MSYNKNWTQTLQSLDEVSVGKGNTEEDSWKTIYGKHLRVSLILNVEFIKENGLMLPVKQLLDDELSI